MTANNRLNASDIRHTLVCQLEGILRQKIEAAVVAWHTPLAPIFRQLAEHYEAGNDAIAAQQARWQYWVFALQPARRDERSSGKGRFTELFGSSVGWSFPDPAAFPREAYDFFQQELAASSYPILCARYADFLWEQGCGDYGIAREAVRAYLATTIHYLTAEESGRLEDALDRAAELAMRLRHTALIAEVKRRAFALTIELLEPQDASSPPLAQHALRVLLSFNSAGPQARLTDAELEEVAALADRAACIYAAFGEYEFERWFLQIVSQACQALGKPADVRLVERRLAKSYERDATSRPRYLDRLYGLEQAYHHYLVCGDRVKADEMKYWRQEAIAKGEAETGTVSVELELPAAKLQELADHVVALDLDKALRELAISEMCVPSVQAARDRAAGERETLPLLSAMPWLTLSKGRVTDVAESEADRTDVIELRAYAVQRVFTDALLHFILARLRTEKGLDAAALLNFLRSGPLFDHATLDTVAVGVERYFAGDYVSAIHVLVPQLEDTLRGILRRAGSPTQEQGADGTTQEMALGKVLAHPVLKRGLGENLSNYFRLLLVAQEADNLRNDVAHGLAKVRDCTEEVAEAVLHCWLLLVPFQVGPTARDTQSRPIEDAAPPTEPTGPTE